MLDKTGDRSVGQNTYMKRDILLKTPLIGCIVPVLIYFLSYTTGRSQEGQNVQQLQRDTMKFSFLIIHIPADTLQIGDSARVTLEMSLDCTNHVTHFDTIFDTTGDDQKVTLEVFGTYLSGPYRPLCAARVVDQDFFINFPRPGEWAIEGGLPGGDVVNAIIVVR